MPHLWWWMSFQVSPEIPLYWLNSCASELNESQFGVLNPVPSNEGAQAHNYLPNGKGYHRHYMSPFQSESHDCKDCFEKMTCKLVDDC